LKKEKKEKRQEALEKKRQAEEALAEKLKKGEEVRRLKLQKEILPRISKKIFTKNSAG
jgi:hypothetical protein